MTDKEALDKVNTTVFIERDKFRSIKISRKTWFERHCGQPLLIVEVTTQDPYDYCKSHPNDITYERRYALCQCKECTYVSYRYSGCDGY